MYATRFVLGVLALALVFGSVGCKKGKGGKVPVASPMSQFVPPDRDDVFPDGDGPAATSDDFETDDEGE